MSELSLDRSLAGHFAVLEDPRDALRRRHNLIEMIVIAIAGVLCGADGWVGGDRRVRPRQRGVAARAIARPCKSMPYSSYTTRSNMYKLMIVNYIRKTRCDCPGVAAAVSGVAQRHPLARYLWAGVLDAGTRGV
jgi:hypothetical protein